MELHTYYSKLELLRVKWGTRIDLDAIRRHFTLLKMCNHYARDLKIITSSDVEEIAIPLTRENMKMIGEMREEALSGYHTVTTAIFNLNPVPSAYLNYFSEFFDSDKSCLRQFSSEETALSWLMKGQSITG